MKKYEMIKKHYFQYIVYSNLKEGYSFTPRTNKNEYMQVNKITITDSSCIEHVLIKKTENAFKKVIKMALHVLEDDETSDSDVRIVLDEIELVREILLNRYQKYMSQEKEKLFLKKLRLIENEMRMKEVQIKQKSIYLERMQNETMNRGRSK